jgi:hypothetical protein
MRPTRFFLVATAVVALATTLDAQPPRAGRPVDREGARERLAERREAWKNLTPEERAAKKDELKERREARLEKLGPDMRTWVDARNTQARSVAEQVKSGALTREQGRAQLQAWIAANPRPATPRNTGTP